MTEVAGQVADGFLCHSLTTGRYLKEVTLPALRRGRAEGGAAADGFSLSLPALVVVGRSREEQDAAAAATRRQIAFRRRLRADRPIGRPKPSANDVVQQRREPRFLVPSCHLTHTA
jgi:alkanesulfonate monooxygenase SsuD/methylene tetrahydromethanopterin reductase-like flavin-dependent oxidoreductase (luciferase family)